VTTYARSAKGAVRTRSAKGAVRKLGAKGSEQRDRVLAAAIEAIAERGPDRVTVRDIASRAGISPSHVLYYFGRRDRILIETLRWSEADLTQRRRAELGRLRSPLKALRRFVALYLPVDAVDLRWNLWNQLVARPPTDPETLAMVGALEREWVDDLVELVRNGRETGAFSVSDPEAFALHARLLMDGVANDIVLGLPGRSASWGVAFVSSALESDLGVQRG
jgi:AcrR family transcriptional regulator